MKSLTAWKLSTHEVGDVCGLLFALLCCRCIDRLIITPIALCEITLTHPNSFVS